MTALEIGVARDQKEIATFADVVRQSLGFSDYPGWLERYDDPDVDVIVARDAGEVVAGCALITMGQWFGGRCVPMVGVNAVGVLPEVRGKRVATDMMRWCVRESARRKVPLMGLYPATQPVYRAVGFEQAGLYTAYRAEMEMFPARDRELEVSVTGMEELELLRPVYTESCRRTQGKLERGRWGWLRVIEPVRRKSYAYKITCGNAVEGYVVFGHRKRTNGHPGFDLACTDLVALTPRALRRIFALFADHSSMARAVYLAGSPTLAELLPCREQKTEVTMQLRWMTRVLEAKRAIEARGFAPQLSGRLVIELEDQLLSEHGGVYTVQIEAGRARVERGGSPEVKLDVGALASLYTGHLAAEDLATLGMIDGEPALWPGLPRSFPGRHHGCPRSTEPDPGPAGGLVRVADPGSSPRLRGRAGCGAHGELDHLVLHRRRRSRQDLAAGR